jgi:hypothetical protein
MGSVWYVYGIVGAKSPASGVPDGLDDSKVAMIEDGDLAALVSELDGDAYDPARVEELSGDVNWVSERAVAHDRVLTWASDRGPVVPLAMYTSIFRDAGGVRAMLRGERDELHAALKRVARGREYALRVYRVDSELKEALPTLDPEIRKMADAAKNASPGQRYLMERKLDERVKEEVRAAGTRIADEIRDALSKSALHVLVSPIPRVAADAPGVMVLNAAFLIAPDRLREFQERLTSIVDEHQKSGFRFDFTGPWPAYHFARGEIA